MASENVLAARWSPSDWKAKSADERVGALYELALGEAKDASNWYQSRKRTKKLCSRLLRALAILFGLLGSVAPLVAAFFRGDSEALEALHIIEGGYILLVCSGGLIIFDKFFGLSSGWIRYVRAIQSIEQLISEFNIDWAALINGQPVSKNDTTPSEFLERVRKFEADLRSVVSTETEVWAAEFETSLTRFETIGASHHTV